VVEILSKSASERHRYFKRRVCEPFGIREYWTVDPEYGFIEILRHGGEGHTPRERLDRASTLRCRNFRELAVVLSPIFERWSRAPEARTPVHWPMPSECIRLVPSDGDQARHQRQSRRVEAS